jgi:hypothetical protein
MCKGNSRNLTKNRSYLQTYLLLNLTNDLLIWQWHVWIPRSQHSSTDEFSTEGEYICRARNQFDT